VKPETKLNFGFVILSTDHNIGHLQATISSIKSQYPGISYISAVPKDTHDDDVEKMSQICPVVKGGHTVTSLINSAIKEGNAEWNVCIMQGSFVPRGLVRKLFLPIKTENDIVFPLFVRYDKQGKPCEIRSEFYNCTLNGLTIHRNTFQKVGNLTDNPLEISKLMWSLEANDLGCKFKAVLGPKMM
jgi:hypothetical protein